MVQRNAGFIGLVAAIVFYSELLHLQMAEIVSDEYLTASTVLFISGVVWYWALQQSWNGLYALMQHLLFFAMVFQLLLSFVKLLSIQEEVGYIPWGLTMIIFVYTWRNMSGWKYKTFIAQK